MPRPTNAELDLSGRRFGRLAVLEVSTRTRKGTLWRCRCDCGRESVVLAGYLRAGDTRSCGCLHDEAAGNRVRTHGQSGSPEWNSWRGMRERCSNPNHASYVNYGAKGVTVCERWLSFANFWADMGPKPSSAHTLERKNNCGNYEPDNCEWASRTKQSRNRSGRHSLTFNGRTMIMAEWAEETGIPFHALSHRIARGWPLERALTEPVRPTPPSRRQPPSSGK